MTEELKTHSTSLSMLKTNRNSVFCVVVRHRTVHHMCSTLSLEAQFNRSKVARPKILNAHSRGSYRQVDDG